MSAADGAPPSSAPVPIAPSDETPDPDPLLRPRPFRKGELWKLALLLVLALVPRLAAFARAQPNPLLRHPTMDAGYHDQWARAILTGKDDLWSGRVYFRAPLYPYLLAGVYAVGGSSIPFAVVLQHLLGAATVVLVFLLARRWFDERVAWVAGLAAAFYWPFVYFEGELLIVTTILFLDVLFLLLLDAGRRSRRKGTLLAAGLVLGLSAIARPTVLILLPLVPLVLLLARQGARRPGWALATLLVWGGAAVPIAPVLVRNWVVGHDLVPIASQAGVNLWIGNNPEADGQTAIAPGTRGDWMGGYEDTIRMAEQEEGRTLKPSEVSHHYFRKALGFLVDQPGRALALMGKKATLFLGAGERSNNVYLYFFWRRFGLASWPLLGFWIVGPLGLAGALLLLKRFRRFAALHLFLLAYSAGVIAFFVNARFRLPVVPVLIVFGAYAALHVVERLRASGWRGAGPLALVAALAVPVNLDWLGFQENTHVVDGVSLFTLGNAYLRAGDQQHALESYEAAREANREHPITAFDEARDPLNFNLGRLYLQRRDPARAIQALERVRGTNPPALDARMLLAACYVERGDPGSATRVYSEILRLYPAQRTALQALLAPGKRSSALEEQRARAIEAALRAEGGS